MSERQFLLVVGSGAAQKYREYSLASIARVCDVVLIDDTKPTWNRPYLVDSVVVDLTDSRAVLEGARTLDARRRISGVMTWDERRLAVTALCAEELGLPHNPSATVAACRDKHLSRTLFAEHDVPSARSVLVRSLEEAQKAAAKVGWPVVLKPRSLAGSIGVMRADDPEAVSRAWQTVAGARMPGVPESDDVLVEEFLSGPEISVECVTHEGRSRAVAVTRKRVGMDPYFEEVGHTVQADDVLARDDSHVVAVALQALTVLGVTTGVSHVELRLTDSGPRLIEVNARLGGDLIPHLVHLATGVDLSRAAAETALGRIPALEPEVSRAAAIEFFYPACDGVLATTVAEPGLTDRPWLDRLDWVAEKGAVVRRPPRAFMGRIGFAVVTGEDAQVCAARLAEVAQRTRVDIDAEATDELVAVFSAINQRVERELVARGQRVVSVVPVGVEPVSGCETYAVDHWDDFTALTALARELERAGVARLETADERCMRAAAFVRGLLGLPGQSLAEATRFTDKSLMKARLETQGVPVARHRLVHDIAEVPAAATELGWPVVVKPRFGFSVINTAAVSSESDLEALVATGVRSTEAATGLPALKASSVLQPLGSDPSGFVVEARVDVETEYHCELLWHEGVEVYCLPFRYPAPMLGATDGPVGSIHLPLDSDEAVNVQELARAAFGALGATDGFAHAEIFRTHDGEWLLGEIASRPGGARIPELLALQYGINVWGAAADKAVGRPPTVQLTLRDASIAWLSVPAPAGRIRAISTVDELCALDGVVEAIVEVSPGEVSNGTLGSLSYAATVFCEAHVPGEAEALARRAAGRVSVEVD